MNLADKLYFPRIEKIFIYVFGHILVSRNVFRKHKGTYYRIVYKLDVYHSVKINKAGLNTAAEGEFPKSYNTVLFKKRFEGIYVIAKPFFEKIVQLFHPEILFAKAGELFGRVLHIIYKTLSEEILWTKRFLKNT